MAVNFITSVAGPVAITNGDETYLLPGEVITSTTDGVNLSAGGSARTEFHNYGTVLAVVDAVEIFSSNAYVVNNGVIQSTLDGIDLQHSTSGTTVRIVNNGDIIAGQETIDVDSANDFSLNLINNGRMISTGGEDIIYLSGLMTSGTVWNTGLIQGRALNIDASGTARLTNSGIIQTTLILMSNSTATRIVNTGEIHGANGPGSNVINAGFNADSVVNSGLIVGDVQMALGNDLFQSAASGQVLGTVLGSGGNDTLVGGDSADTLSGGNQDDLLVGRGGDDSLDGGLDNDFILGGTGNDELLGGGGNDTLNGNSGADQILGDTGSDVLVGQGGDDRLEGGDNDDTLDGGAGDDVLEGDAGNDILRGRSGEDELAGGLGRDFLTGGQDADVFVFRALAETVVGAMRDQILDFEQGVDLIAVAGLSPGVFEFRGTAAFAPSGNPELRLQETATGSTIVLIDADGDGTQDAEIRVANVTGLTADDFVL
ncbi:calcium-binding protein [uncultured Mameliella sp.]|uniref:calcium-binding protein n=1 Tax=uncultured Mameliella sp. TaxID=1447087 RepID=UPI00261F56DA|nr:calcium-binding protein [uncultured Mameliella sp.]